MEPQCSLARRGGGEELIGIVTAAERRHPFASLSYARAFGPTSEPFDIAPWGAPVLARTIPSSDRRDALNCYPFLPFPQGAELEDGLACLHEQGFVSVVLVTDPLRQPAEDRLVATFTSCRPFKTHYVFDRRLGIDKSGRRWREVNASREALDIREISYASHVDAFIGLYGNLVDTHQIVGTTSFSPAFFRALAGIEGFRAIGAFLEGQLVSMMLFVRFEDTAYAFLAGTSAEGRRHSAHYGLYGFAIERFDDVRFVNLGGAPGLVDDPRHGIAHVKRKLTNVVMQSYLCGAILDPVAYRSLAGDRAGCVDFFPAYR